MDTVEYRECVITTLTRRGKGKEDSPIRIVTQVWVRNSNGSCSLIAEEDPCAPVYDGATGRFKERLQEVKSGN